jgi:hypothetical protein
MLRKKVDPRAQFLLRIQAKHILPVLEILHNPAYDESIKTPLRKFQLITNVSIIEEVLLQLFARTIDDKQIDISVFDNKRAESYDASSGLSKGKYICMHPDYYFGSPKKINKAFSKLLKTNAHFRSKNVNCYAIKHSDSRDPYRWYKEYRTRPLYKNWDNFMSMFEWRNTLIHGLSRVGLSNAKIATLCDNTMVFLDIAISFCTTEGNDAFDTIDMTLIS